MMLCGIGHTTPCEATQKRGQRQAAAPSSLPGEALGARAGLERAAVSPGGGGAGAPDHGEWTRQVR